MSGPVSAFAQYSEEISSSPQNDSVLSASRKRKRVSMANTNGHLKDKKTNKNRSKSLQPVLSISETNGQSKIIEQLNTTKKSKNSETKFLSPAYPTPYPQRRVIVSGPRHSQIDKPTLEENGETDEDEDEDDEDENEDESPLSAWLHDHVPIADSTLLGEHLFGLLIDPIPIKQFIKRTWQRETLLIQRKQPTYYNGLFSTSDIDDILRDNTLEYGENIDLTFYNSVTSKKERHNPEGRARAAVVWDAYNEGCSVRILNPHAYSTNIWKLLSCLQEYFGSLVGANTYLTPPGSQGFAPHYDDIDAFILQLEGKKHWRVYKPLNDDEVLPIKSSFDLDKNIIENIKPCIDVVLEAGDLLYMPRGYIHYGYTLDDAHSLHLTVSCYQQQTWGDLFKILLPKAVDYAVKTNVKFRQGLPLGYLNQFGLIHSTKKLSMKKRAKFHANCHRLLDELLRESVPIQMDNSVDIMAQKFMHDALPPILTAEEQLTTIQEQGERWNSDLNRVSSVVELEPDTRIRLLRRHCLRVVEHDHNDEDDEDNIVAYYTTDNARNYHDRPLSTLGVDKETLPALEMLFTIYPEYISIDSLPLATIEDKITFVSTLYEKGLVRTEYELEHSDGEDEEEDESDNDEEDESDSDEEDGLVLKRQKVRNESTDDDDDDDEDEDVDDDN
ncbi:unnamed protein product [Rotaria sordida]|uniref:Bifunctional lysine-specific demethylase and histidyl-hydroxylase n=1 Tax=Rotaria sordida TaxID=392033 RepID=A0A818PDB1_9BILA|nr:unnamed protein product [Rotaria sordida]CAF3622893.1 unnamed protein product [Rotaria sordida]